MLGLISETTLRQVVGGRVLQSVISDREGLAQEVAEIVCPPHLYLYIYILIPDRSNSREMGSGNRINLAQRYQLLCRAPTIPFVRCYSEANW
jgi:hypothetical protein